MRARGKREAKRSASPLVTNNQTCPALKGRNWRFGISALQALVPCALTTRGDALRACPWLLYVAPLALLRQHALLFEAFELLLVIRLAFRID